MSVSTGPEHAKRIFKAYLSPTTVVAMLTECADFDGQAVADEAFGKGVWSVVQYGSVGSPEAGSLVAVRLARAKVQRHQGTIGSKAGEGIRERTIVTATVLVDGGTPWAWTGEFSAGHAPPARAPRGRRVFMRKLATVGGTRAGDMNLQARAIARYLQGTRVFGVGVLAVAVPRWIQCGNLVKLSKRDLADADHRGAEVLLWPRQV